MSAGPGLHAFLIGVGNYPRLQAPSLSAVAPTVLAIQEWLESSYRNPACPLGSIELLVSAPDRTGMVTMPNVQRTFERWYERCSSHEDNIAFFYFCGHGMGQSDPLLLLEDFDPASANPGGACLDFSRTRSGMLGCRAQTQLYFVDADREPATGRMASITGTALILPKANDRPARSIATYFAAGPGGHSFSPVGTISIFAEALLKCFAGSAAVQSGNVRYIDMSSLGRVLDEEMKQIGAELNLPLRSQYEVVGNVRFHIFADEAATQDNVDAPVQQQNAPPPRVSRKGEEVVSQQRVVNKDKDDASPQQQQAEEREHVLTHPDDPATIDALDRRPFAQVLAMRIEQARESLGDRHSAFMVHIHGPWGSGKTSILNFLSEALKDEKTNTEPWVVVNFNAWRHQRLRPPWWSLITEIHAQAVRQLPFFRSLLLRLQWFLWRARADWLPVLFGIILITIAALLATGVIDLGKRPAADQATPPPAVTQPAAPTSAPAQGAQAKQTAQAVAAAAQAEVNLASTMKNTLDVIVAIIAVATAVFTLSRSLLMGSAKAAQTYLDLRTDPLHMIVRLLRSLIGSIRRPVAVFIDDLDRCDSAYVVELLEGMQTLFQSVRITYVIAADRKWICSSFDKAYGDFGKTIGQPGRPLGYLFLEKVFQISASVPRLSLHVRQTFWTSLLDVAGSNDPKKIEATRKQAEARAQNEVKDLRTPEEMERKISTAGDPVQQQAMRAAAAKQMATPEVQQVTEHRLKKFASLLESNPRSMKRFVNAYGLKQSTHLLEGRRVSSQALAQWTIIELRWPLLAEHLSMYPESIGGFGSGDASNVPRALQPLFKDWEVKAVVTAGGAQALDEKTLREIV